MAVALGNLTMVDGQKHHGFSLKVPAALQNLMRNTVPA
jgi:hypothetical protein